MSIIMSILAIARGNPNYQQILILFTSQPYVDMSTKSK